MTSPRHSLRRLVERERFGDRFWEQVPGASGPLGRLKYPIDEGRKPHRSTKNKAGSANLQPADEHVNLHGKEGVDGSSPSEGSAKFPLISPFRLLPSQSALALALVLG